jgi:peptide-methionine (S)-S-oxide reductase
MHAPSTRHAMTLAFATLTVGGLLTGCDRRMEGRSMSEPKPSASGQTASLTPAAQPANATTDKLETAIFGAGCFWGVEAEFRKIDGVVATEVGYAGGHTENPTYKQVCTDRTGHAEVVKVTYDPSKVSYDELLDLFWRSHNPTQVNRQGPDVGTQYRSVIFYTTPEQEAAARASKQKLEASGRFRRPIATQIEPAGPFYRAEEYHQQYLEKRGMASCHIGMK